MESVSIKMPPIGIKVVLKRAALTSTSPLLANGEMAYDTANSRIVVGDGYANHFFPVTPTGVGYYVPQSYLLGGETAGYVTGGLIPSNSDNVDTIQKFPFSSRTPAVDVAELAGWLYDHCGVSSATDGYLAGGIYNGNSSPAPFQEATGRTVLPALSPSRESIERFPFSSDAPATITGSLGNYDATWIGAQASSPMSSPSAGYVGCGFTSTTPNTLPTTCVKFPYASDGTTVTLVGNTIDPSPTTAGHSAPGCGASSQTDGYVVGGNNGSGYMDRFPFSSDTNSTASIALNTPLTTYGMGTSSETAGYICGGPVTGGGSTRLESFTFASDTSAESDAGELSKNRWGGAGISYRYGGYIASDGDIDFFPYASAVTATEIGDLIANRTYVRGNQV